MTPTNDKMQASKCQVQKYKRDVNGNVHPCKAIRKVNTIMRMKENMIIICDSSPGRQFVSHNIRQRAMGKVLWAKVPENVQ